MRNYKYRGLPFEDVDFDNIDVHIKKDEFVYGNLIVDGDTAYIVNGIVECSEDNLQLERWIPVRPETVGQLVQLSIDENSDEIYEGDKVIMELSETCIIEGIVTYALSEYFVSTESDDWEIDMYQSLKVIGNIHEVKEV